MAYFDLMLWVQEARWKLRRVDAKRKWGKGVLAKQPIVVVNAIPKSGSHLLTQVMEGLFPISALVDTGMPPLNRGSHNLKYAEDAPIQKRILGLRAGDFAYGYMNANQNFVPFLEKEPYVVLFSYRDPRDVVVSQVKYATEVNESNYMRGYYQGLASDEERINATICGVVDTQYGISSILKRYEGYLGWMDGANVLPVKFEDLILDREATFVRILNFLKGRGLTLMTSDEEAIASMHAAVQPKKSGTFRKGQPGGWKEAFTEENKRIFKEETGDLVVRLGYEENMDW